MKRTLGWILENIEEGEVWVNNRLAVKEISKKDGVVYFKQRDNNNNSLPLKMDNEYKKNQTPVDFMTAVKSGKRIKVERSSILNPIYNKYMELSDILETLGCNLFSTQVSDIIINGKWYIEEDDE